MFTLLKALLPAAWPLWAIEAVVWVVLAGTAWLTWENWIAEPYRVQGEVREVQKLNAPKGQITLLMQQVKKLESDLTASRDETSQALANLELTKKSLDTVLQKLDEANTMADHWLQQSNAAHDASAKMWQELKLRRARYTSDIEAARRIAAGPPRVAAPSAVHGYLVDLSTWRNAK